MRGRGSAAWVAVAAGVIAGGDGGGGVGGATVVGGNDGGGGGGGASTVRDCNGKGTGGSGGGADVDACSCGDCSGGPPANGETGGPLGCPGGYRTMCGIVLDGVVVVVLPCWCERAC